MRLNSEKMLMLGGGNFKPKTFIPSKELQAWKVPAGVREIMVEAAGSKGCEYKTGGTNPGNYASAGKGGVVKCRLKVTPGSTLYFWVGKSGTLPNERVNNSSDIRIGGRELSNRVLVAGGGGASGWADPKYCGYVSNIPAGKVYIAYGGGAGGGTTGGYTGTGFKGTVSQLEGRGGSQNAGGTGSRGSGDNYTAGSSGQLGTGGAGACSKAFSAEVSYPANAARGGAGGGGYYGGGGGGTVMYYRAQAGGAGGGGGGSSYTNPSYCSDVKHTQGGNNGAGYVKISMVSD